MKNIIDGELSIFCENIKTLRKREGLSKKEMAEKLGIGIKNLTLLERGVVSKRLGANILINIQRNFHISPNKMFSTTL